MGMKQGIYVIEAHDGNRVDQITRVVVVAIDTAEAEIKAASAVWPQADMSQRAEMIEDGRLELGRLGDYDPGITGARMSTGAVVAVQRIGQR